MTEVELKFELPAEAQAALRAHPELARSRPVEKHLLALYFDTPAQELAANEMALRLRRSGKRWIQGLKAGRSGSGGLHAREEWEFEQRRPTLDLALFTQTPLANLADSRNLHERLEEIFRVDMQRTTWEVEVSPGHRVEVALDRGEVRRDGASEQVSEVEIESIAGAPFAVFELAQRLLATVPMRPSTVTKASRGYRLLRGEEIAPVHADPARLRPDATALEGARHAIAVALEQLQANEEGMASDDPEFVHQMRSALRRLRSALRVFRKVLPPGLEDGIRDDVRWLADLMGTARDWDVLATETLPPLLLARGDSPGSEALVEAVAKRRAAARRVLQDALASPRHGNLVLALARWLAQTRDEPSPGGDVRKLATRVLRKQHRGLIHAVGHLSHEDAVERHRIRIAAKRFRYAVDALESLYAARRVKSLVRPLGKVQAALGDANDAAVAWRLISSLDPPSALAHFARGWLEARSAVSIEDFERHAARLVAAIPFWRKT